MPLFPLCGLLQGELQPFYLFFVFIYFLFIYSPPPHGVLLLLLAAWLFPRRVYK
jgi:hypothetical protein